MYDHATNGSDDEQRHHRFSNDSSNLIHMAIVQRRMDVQKVLLPDSRSKTPDTYISIKGTESRWL